ncbi:MAG: hypothetical protein AAGG51_05810 [Cyanobacteria bacterium P01_G01_bin.54]
MGLAPFFPSETLLPSGFMGLPLANAGVPLFTTNLYWQVILLIPIGLIELWVHRKILKIRLLTAAKIAIATNISSTLIGVLLLFAIAPLGLFDVIAAPAADNTRLVYWVGVRLLGGVLMGGLSVGLEGWLGSWLIKGSKKNRRWRSFLWANTFSYLFLMVAIALHTLVDLAAARQAITVLETELTQLAQQCPVVVKSKACDRVFDQRVAAYRQLGRIHRQRGDLKHYFRDGLEPLNQLYEDTAKTCSPNDDRAVCPE